MFIYENKYEGTRTFEEYPFELSNFQKNAIEALDKDHNVLVTAGTGSGKTLVAEYLIKNRRKGKKIIYTAPIKALSNCLLNEFTKKFPDISFGIMTGDIKFNPEADCIIMTTEILRNLLYNKKIKTNTIELSIEIDIYNDVSAVIFDEVHYIADNHRGKVWEECIILLPKYIQLLMLSATIDSPEIFGKWVENIKEIPLTLSITKNRVVPLNHYIYMNFSPKFIKNDKYNFYDSFHHKITKLMDHNNIFNNDFYEKSIRIQKNYSHFMPKKSIFNELTLLLKEKNLLPCIMFTLSRNKCEQYAKSIIHILNDIDEQIKVSKIFDSLLRKTGNFDSIIKLDEYHTIKELLKKGIAYHHSGLYPIFKEAIEILLSHKDENGKYKPLVKLLFATETFAVGVNMPTKCVCYTGLTKFSDGNFRLLESHEYKQMSGRAGRRGIDKEGITILLPNLYELPNLHDMNKLMNGKNKKIFSKFDPNFQFLLKLILIGNGQINSFINQTLLNEEIKKDSHFLRTKLDHIKLDENIESEYEKCIEYEKLQFDYLPGTSIRYSSKQKKKNKKKAYQIEKSIQDFKHIYNEYLKLKQVIFDKRDLENQISFNNHFITNKIINITGFLKNYNYLDQSVNIEDYHLISESSVKLKGIIASQINECNEILFTEIIAGGYLDNLNFKEICCICSLFIEGKEEVYISDLKLEQALKSRIKDIFTKQNDIMADVDKYKVYLDYNWELSCEKIEPILDWLNLETLNNITKKYGIFSGNFVKDCIKLNNIIQDVIKVSKILNKLELMEEASKIESILIRDNVNLDSLYI